jgi:hypothetical protein
MNTLATIAKPQSAQRVTQVQWLTRLSGCPVDFIPLDKETRTHVSTKVMCYHLGRKEQTARGWACHEDGPLRPTRICGRLAWAVADIKRILGV